MKAFSSVLEKIAKRWGYLEILGLIKREIYYVRRRFSGRYARYGIDSKLELLMPYREGFYVELGANDGALASNTYYFELKKDWRGVLIEPVPNLFLSCLKRRGAENYVACNACISFGYKEKFVPMRYADSMSISTELDLDIGSHQEFLEKGFSTLKAGEKSFEFAAKASTLTDILLAADAPHQIDLLSLDVEGAELEVLKGIDFDRYNFKYMVIECRDIERLTTYLFPYGYRLLEKITHHDYLFSHTKLL